MESRQTTAGRLRSAIFDMELRAPFLEGHLLGLDNVSNGPLVFPQGTAAYLYGSSVLKYVEDRYGPLKLRDISHRYGRSFIPGAINRIAAAPLAAATRVCWSRACGRNGRSRPHTSTPCRPRRHNAAACPSHAA